MSDTGAALPIDTDVDGQDLSYNDFEHRDLTVAGDDTVTAGTDCRG